MGRRQTLIAWALACAAQRCAGEVIWTEWSALEGAPPARSKMAVVLSERVNYLNTDPKLLMFGGCDAGGARNDLWTASLDFLPTPSVEVEANQATKGSVPLNPDAAPAWQEIAARGTWPAARCEHTMTALSDGRVVLFGGTSEEDGSAALNDLWLYDVVDLFTEVAKPLNTSTSATCDTDGRQWPYRRFGHTAAALGSTMWVFGGWISACGLNSVTDELWSYNPDGATVVDGRVTNVGWERHRPMSLRPSARTGHNMLQVDGSLIALGGWDGLSPTDDMWSYDPATTRWEQLRTDNSPAEPPPDKRYGASVDAVAGGMAIYGGSDQGAVADGTNSFFADVWVFTFPVDVTETTRSISESMGDGSGTMTKTTTVRTAPVNMNLWMQQALGTEPAPQRAYHGTLVWGNPGYEHIVVVGGSDDSGKPIASIGVLTLNGEVPSKTALYVGIVSAAIGALIFCCCSWRVGKRHRLKRIRRRWQNAYLMVVAHLETKRQREEEREQREEEEANDVRAAESALRRRSMKPLATAAVAKGRRGSRRGWD